ncbi:MAG: beta-lactamase family protein [Burkholderiales bacterium]|nr:beta-lactamase family protein [Burkholderiales bacterium]
MNPPIPIRGHCAEAFAPVRDAFAASLADGFALGACVAVVRDGAAVVDLWAGHRDAARRLPWEADTLVCMMSVSKAIAATCVLRLADQGRLDLEWPVARVWPAFAGGGKGAITIAQVLGQEAGIPFADAAPEGSLWQPGVLAAALESQVPEWPPGSTPCYHSFTAGPLYGEIVRRVDGRSLGRFLAEEITGPHGIDFHIGLTEEVDRRRAEYVVTPGTASWDGITRRVPAPLNRAWRPLPADEDVNSRDWRFGEFPSANGHGNARAAARLYAMLADPAGPILSRRMVERAIAARWDGVEAMTQRHFRYGLGFMLDSPPFPLRGARNFGHPGVGGPVAFGDPDRGLGFGFAVNRMVPVADIGPARALIDATYSCLPQ